MKRMNFDRAWTIGPGMGAVSLQPETQGRLVNLPHDYMIETDVTPDAPAGAATGYYTAGVAHYTKQFMIPAEWAGEEIYLLFDGVMLNVTVEVNGCKAALQHYGYAPFAVNLTPYVYPGEENTVNIVVNPSMQPNSRWYSGAGIFRSVQLAHSPKVHIAPDGIFAYTKDMDWDGERAETAFLHGEVHLVNATAEKRIVHAELQLIPEKEKEPVCVRTATVQLPPMGSETAYFDFSVDQPRLWDIEHPNLYTLKAKVTEAGFFKTHLIPIAHPTEDEDTVLFGIRTVTADAKHGLRINGKSVKLAGGCVHHDNGVLGAISVYDAEERRVRKLKDIGFNAIRTTHNPPSAALMEACDRLGLYVFAEAFDAWGMGKQPGDYNQYFDGDWEKDLGAFMRRDRNHPAIVLWSTGNEITERAGLNDGYTLATKLARAMKGLDPSRPVSNGICSFWNGLDTYEMAENHRRFLAKMGGEGNGQNVNVEQEDPLYWERHVDPFTNGLDIVGYNYMENLYPQDHELYPDRVILGSENYPKEIGFRWPEVLAHPYIIGDFTWTAVDYIGEAGIGKTMHVEPDDPIVGRGPWAVMSQVSQYPWRLAHDADLDIHGGRLAQGDYRSVVFGSEATYVYSYDPAVFGKTEMLSQWGFPNVQKCWNWPGAEGKPVTVTVYSRAEEVELFLNGVSQGTKKVSEADPTFPNCVRFNVTYQPGTLKAISFRNGEKVSEDDIVTTGGAARLSLKAEKAEMAADGHSLIYVSCEVVDGEGRTVPNAEVPVCAEVSGVATLAGFGSANPMTEENYTAGRTVTYRGKVLAVLRSGYEKGTAKLTVKAEGMEEASCVVECRAEA